MYTRKNQNNLKYLYIDLLNEDTNMDFDKLCEFIELFDNNDLNFIFNYNCLEYIEIEKLTNFLVSKFKNFIIKGEKFSHIEKLESLNCIIDEFRFKMNPLLGPEIIEHKITSNTQLLNYIVDLNKDNILKFGVDLYVNSNNLFYIKETLKILSNKDIESKILFDENPLNSHYLAKKLNSNTVDNSYETEILFDNIISDNELKISNKDDIRYMLHNYMTNRCWKKYYPIQLCLDASFKLRICNKIDICLDLDPLQCFEEGNLKEDVFHIIKDKCSEYCLGCNCEDIISEL